MSGKGKDTIGCSYDWAPGFRWERLQCQVHKHPAGSGVILRRLTPDALTELNRRQMLSGGALVDAGKVAT